MDYERRYKELVDKFGVLLNLEIVKSSGVLSVEDIRKLIPELAESEDDRIRKDIVEAVELHKDFTQGRKEHIYAWLKKQGGQKPTDKVKPKFHEGDWIIHQGTENIFQVLAIIVNQYQLKYGDNYTVQKCADVDRCARLWDITKDAKDGDILIASDNSIFIFKEVNDYGCKHYLALTKDGTLVVNKNLTHFWEAVHGAYPATKEQRDTLIKTMTDAGYTFDFEKKELKKIEQKSIDNDIKEALRMEYEKGRADAIAEMQNVWSEEDETMLCEIILDLSGLKDKDNGEEGKAAYQKEIDWLKSLKERIQP